MAVTGSRPHPDQLRPARPRPARSATGAERSRPVERRDDRPERVDELLAAAVGAVPAGPNRPGQQAMAHAVADAARHGEHLLVQAGTGTGKSLAYLAPALLVDGPVVISTATLALQSQLVDHDLPRLADAVEPILGRRPLHAVLKGRHHYLCLAQLESSNEEEPDDALFDTGGGARPKTVWLGEAGRLGKQMQRLRDWATETETGDRDELDPGVDDTAWRQVSTFARECVGAARCAYGAECFAEASRARAREADIVVTNHSLLAVDMLAGRHIVPPHRLLVVDEAHDLADRVSSASQAEVSPDVIDRGARRARSLIGADIYEQLIEAGDALAIGLGDAMPGRLTAGLPGTVARGADAARRGHPPGSRSGRRNQDRRPRPRSQAAGAGHPRRAVEDIAAAAGGVSARRRLDRDQRPSSRRRRRPAHRRRHAVHTPVHANARSSRRRRRWHSAASSTPWPARSASPRTPSTEDPTTAPSWTSLDVGSPFDYPRQGILYVASQRAAADAVGPVRRRGRGTRRAGECAGRPYPRIVLVPARRRARGRGPARNGPT